MDIVRNGSSIGCIEDWARYAPPKAKYQWVEGRSAYELARAWCGSGTPAMPPELKALFDSCPETQNLSVASVTPEQQIAFDAHGGEPRNADLAFIGTTLKGKVAVTVEAKADEPFGKTVGEVMSDALERLVRNPRSRGVARVQDLARALFRAHVQGLPKVGDLRYQLLTAVAGTIAYAQQHGARLAVLVIHEFVTPKTRDDRHARNCKDYQDFLARLNGQSSAQSAGVGMVGPFRIPGEPLFEEIPSLLVGKVVVTVQGA